MAAVAVIVADGWLALLCGLGSLGAVFGAGFFTHRRRWLGAVAGGLAAQALIRGVSYGATGVPTAVAVVGLRTGLRVCVSGRVSGQPTDHPGRDRGCGSRDRRPHDLHGSQRSPGTGPDHRRDQQSRECAQRRGIRRRGRRCRPDRSGCRGARGDRDRLRSTVVVPGAGSFRSSVSMPPCWATPPTPAHRWPKMWPRCSQQSIPETLVVDGTIDVVTLSDLAEPMSQLRQSLRSALDDTDRLDSTWLVPAASERVDRAAGGACGHARRCRGRRRSRRRRPQPARRRRAEALSGPVHHPVRIARERWLRRQLGRARRWIVGASSSPRPAGATTSTCAIPGGVIVPENLARLYSGFELERTFQNITVVPDFPTVAALAKAQFEQAFERRLDGVIGVDHAGMGGIIRLTGPVEVDGMRLNARQAEDFILKRPVRDLRRRQRGPHRRARGADGPDLRAARGHRPARARAPSWMFSRRSSKATTSGSSASTRRRAWRWGRETWRTPSP